MSETKRDYQVSRAKPPVHSRFKKGQSGNRRGPRPKSLLALLVDALNEKVVATIDGERREITQRKAVSTQLDGEPHHKAAAILGGETSRQRPGVMLPPPQAPQAGKPADRRLDLSGAPMTKLRKLTWPVFVVAAAVSGVPARGQQAPESPPTPALPAPMVPPPLPYSPPLPADNSASSIGSAEMDRNGTIRLHLSAAPRSAPEEGMRQVVPWSQPQERIGYEEIELNPSNAYYNDVLRHLEGLLPGQTKPVPPWRTDEKWHCALDPDRGPCPLQHLLPHRALVL